jgi:hypothetical protein
MPFPTISQSFPIPFRKNTVVHIHQEIVVISVTLHWRDGYRARVPQAIRKRGSMEKTENTTCPSLTTPLSTEGAHRYTGLSVVRAATPGTPAQMVCRECQ